jgi:large conductance mechanosensitive channel
LDNCREISEEKGDYMFKEFREFAMRGNVIDLAVGIMIGAAFNRIVNSFVNDILMPPIGLLVDETDFSNLFISLSGEDYPSLAAAQAEGAATLNYGLFINNLIDFIIIAFILFLIVRKVNVLKSRLEPVQEESPTVKGCPYCYSTIPIKATRCPSCTSEL